MPQPAPPLEGLFDNRVGVENAHPAEQLDDVEKVSGRTDRRVDVEAVATPRVEVVRAVSGRGVHGAGSRIERDVVAEHRQRRPCIEWMLEANALELGALHSGDDRPERTA